MALHYNFVPIMQDILLSPDYDLKFSIAPNGDEDFFIGESTQQEIQLIILAEKGDWKFSPVLGAGIRRFIHGGSQQRQFESDIRLQLSADGMTVSKVQATQDASGQTLINVKATRQL